MPQISDITKTRRVPTSIVFSSATPNGVNQVGLLFSSGSIKEAVGLQTSYALGKLRLFKATLPPLTVSTLKAALVAAECDFSGYTPGGVAVTAWFDPMTSGIGAQIVSPNTQFNFVDPDPDPAITNAVGGWWYEDAAGVARIGQQFESAINMASNTDSIAIVLSDYLGNG